MPRGLRRLRFAAMGTTVSLLLPARAAADGYEAVRALFAGWEATLSRFLPTSELSRLNERAGRAVPVSPLLFMLVETALAAARDTDGLYDPTLLRQITLTGYDRSFATLPAHLPPAPGSPAPGGGWRGVRLDHARRTVTLPAGCGLDLGGIAKGLAVDAALARLRDAGVTPALVNAGGDLAVVESPPDREDWSIAVPGRDRSWAIPLHHGALATSGVARRRWRQGATPRHHLLDPRTGAPAASGLWSVTAAAATCAQAEVAAKVAFLLGLRAGVSFLQERGLAGLLVAEDGAWRPAGPWPVAAMDGREPVAADIAAGQTAGRAEER